ncbi:MULTISPECIES: guanitoxin biosynthesis L-enduracididine beta-hydroxylase GntD [unclassified Streptomyces]|uniref:guanitoxin biosynthesis L-enduracididine beta-hydroxylase GntD n=1 Tax=unclassified Streptomyces TaxID=2593676 RepID=UPI000DACD6E2|nr:MULTISPECIES: guanitoxin biosynthesis L-enduracididine beta-hydroxylase GntD [unclassified Streptomyces]PZT76127.1 clavaminate synthase [Streptomyces sp. AC1-42W]PZT79921.1 clavaminate synthase [Streptomyces sp. AC1-42T]
MSNLTVPTAPELTPRAADGVPCLELTDTERTRVQDIADHVLDTEPGLPLEQRLDQLSLLAHELPARVRATFGQFRLTGRPFGGFVISNLPIDEAEAGPTPLSYTDVPDSREAQRAAASLLLLGSLLGDPVSYLTQQRGRMVLDLFPIAGHENEQLGSSSTVNLEWHNEDAFHPLRADWIMLIGLRNHDKVPTTFAPVQEVELDDRTREVLFQERFVILPDESHTASFNAGTTGVEEGDWVAEAFRKIAEMNEEPRRTSVLSGNPDSPFICIDPAFMPRDLDPEAAAALDAVVKGIDAKLRDVSLAPGEMLIVDNKRAVHGRRPFAARYDGTDRWLRRINVMADLRKAEGRRYSDHGRALV